MPWRSGFYYIAKEMGWKLRVSGFDFERRCFVFGPVRDLPNTYDKALSIMQEDMSQIVPAWVSRSEVNIRPFDIRQHGMVSFWMWVMWTSILFRLL